MPKAPFTYTEVGATNPLGRSTADWDIPAEYHQLRLRRRIGSGKALFEKVGTEILAYRMQKGAYIFRSADTPTAEVGTHLTVRLGPIPAPCRVVYVLDEPTWRGFAYGTLPGHPEIGEELFAVTYDPATDEVHAIVEAFARPGTWYTRLGGPVARMMQRLVAEQYIRALPRS